MLALLRFASICDGKMQKKVKKQTMKISCMCTFNGYDSFPAIERFISFTFL
jgi:hypothetical protein